jgi:hypothetical protein
MLKADYLICGILNMTNISVILDDLSVMLDDFSILSLYLD